MVPLHLNIPTPTPAPLDIFCMFQYSLSFVGIVRLIYCVNRLINAILQDVNQLLMRLFGQLIVLSVIDWINWPMNGHPSADQCHFFLDWYCRFFVARILLWYTVARISLFVLIFCGTTLVVGILSYGTRLLLLVFCATKLVVCILCHESVDQPQCCPAYHASTRTSNEH